MTPAARLLLIRAGLVKRRAARERRRRLAHDLACYSTEAERADLLATCAYYPDGYTAEIRDILVRQAARNAVRDWPALRGGRPRHR
jgi:hypothetical protein